MSIDVTLSGLNTTVDVTLNGTQEAIQIDSEMLQGGTIPVSVSGLDTGVTTTLSTAEPIDIEAHDYIYIGGETYHGAYEVIPDTEVHILPTANKTMEGDVTVREIPYYETSNVQGTTVYIGGN